MRLSLGRSISVYAEKSAWRACGRARVGLVLENKPERDGPDEQLAALSVTGGVAQAARRAGAIVASLRRASRHEELANIKTTSTLSRKITSKSLEDRKRFLD
jgi:hypothetical protein